MQHRILHIYHTTQTTTHITSYNTTYNVPTYNTTYMPMFHTTYNIPLNNTNYMYICIKNIYRHRTNQSCNEVCYDIQCVIR